MTRKTITITKYEDYVTLVPSFVCLAVVIMTIFAEPHNYVFGLVTGFFSALLIWGLVLFHSSGESYEVFVK